MHRHSLSCGVALVLSAVMGMAACAWAGPTAATDDRTSEATLLSNINTTIGEAPCTADAQCRTLGVGARACGGPAAWRAWSTQSTSAQDLQPLADQLAALQRDRQARSGMASTCQYLPDPGAACVDRRCVLKPAPASGS